jgi:hypothetical protein
VLLRWRVLYVSTVKEPNGKENHLYCIEQEALSTKLEKQLFKVVYARISLYTRMSDYRSAYGIIPFKFYCSIQIPAVVFGEREGYTLNKQKLHEQLSEDGKGAGANEWHFDLNHIMDVFYSFYIELVGTIEK